MLRPRRVARRRLPVNFRQDDLPLFCYFTMASALGLEYFYQTCPSDDPTGDPHTAHLRVAPGALADNIRLMLGG